MSCANVSKTPPHISVVTPAYRCAECLPELYKRLKVTIEKIDPNFEFIIVNDCSPDNDWEIIRKLAKADQRVKGINFARNFGQHHAITAGNRLCDWRLGSSHGLRLAGSTRGADQTL